MHELILFAPLSLMCRRRKIYQTVPYNPRMHYLSKSSVTCPEERPGISNAPFPPLPWISAFIWFPFPIPLFFSLPGHHARSVLSFFLPMVHSHDFSPQNFKHFSLRVRLTLCTILTSKGLNLWKCMFEVCVWMFCLRMVWFCGLTRQKGFIYEKFWNMHLLMM